MNDPIAVAEVLERAADLIVVDGWMQGGWGQPGGRRCADGHLRSACNEQLGVNGFQRSPAPFVYLYCNTLYELGFTEFDITNWNDQNGRTAGEVRDLFLTTAKNIRNGVDGATNLKEPSQ